MADLMEAIRKVSAKKAGATGHQYAHQLISFADDLPAGALGR
jgi:hypothetical protein